jgi:hypothetical protein
MKRITLTGCLPLLASLLVLGGCGYSFDSLYPEQYKTVCVPMWTRGRDVYRREIEFRITEAVQKRIEGFTPYRLAHKARADTELTGSLDQVLQRPLSMNPDTNRPREMAVTFVVSFKWVDLATGRTIVERSNFRVEATYYPIDPLGEDFFQGSEDAVNRLAERVVEQMQIPMAK